MQPFVGAGGWGYLKGGLAAYARGFSFVEVNATFYRAVPDELARRWRRAVPSDFVFSIKVHRGVTHVDRLRATAAGRAAFARSMRTARILRAPFAILETPKSLAFDPEQVKGLRELSGMVGPEVRLGLEARAYRGERLPEGLAGAMVDQGILDVVDLSQGAPRIAADDVYTRLFGPGPHNVYEFDDGELQEIDRGSHDGDAVRAAFAFHGVRMYKDAARFLTFKRTGSFPAATSHRGLESFEEVLRPDARFPATRDDLLRDHGWKVFDLDTDTRAHASTVLARLPSIRYSSLEEVLKTAVKSGPLGGPSQGAAWASEGPLSSVESP